MATLLHKLILIALGGFCLGAYAPADQVVTLLAAFFLSCLCQYFERRPVSWAVCAFYAFLCMLRAPFVLFLPVFCCDLVTAKTNRAVLLAIPALLWLRLDALGLQTAGYILLLCLMASALQTQAERAFSLEADIKSLRDDSTELTRLLERRNLDLVERQNAELELARMTERNRIAREIHDNVGHLLSRALLQTGAIRSLSRGTGLAQNISGLQDTLNQAMDGIRQSVHGLREDPIDLYVAIKELIASYAQTYTISLDYDISGGIPADVKYCFLMLVKEAMTNTARHSDATDIHISAQEHPAMYQIAIRDNGSMPPKGVIGGGIGLQNMEERVATLGGRFHAGWDRGFRIFASIPLAERRP